MRTSSYTITIKLQEVEDYLLIHGYTGVIDLVKTNVVSFLKNYPNDIQQNFISDESIKILEKRGYLTDLSDEDEKLKVKALAKILHRISTKRKSFLSIFLKEII